MAHETPAIKLAFTALISLVGWASPTMIFFNWSFGGQCPPYTEHGTT